MDTDCASEKFVDLSRILTNMVTGYRLESYSWRDREEKFNEELPQFRTAIEIDAGDGEKLSSRVHMM